MTVNTEINRTNPFLARFISSLPKAGLDLAEIHVSPFENGFLQICHRNDCQSPREPLRQVDLVELRQLVDWTAEGAFRPLKSAPNLVRGWVWKTGVLEELELALNIIYPGALADLYWNATGNKPVTSFRDFAERQSGMYRIIALSTDQEIRRVYSACCQSRFCLRRRHWGVLGAEPEEPVGKSSIPCFEPCALLLELARKSVRLRQESVQVEVSREELDYLGELLTTEGRLPAYRGREADFNDLDNPRRRALLLEKLKRFNHGAGEQ